VLTTKLRRRGYRQLRVRCHAAGPPRYYCTVNGAQLWRAHITPGGAVRLELVGSE